jgi:hypothetical protein
MVANCGRAQNCGIMGKTLKPSSTFLPNDQGPFQGVAGQEPPSVLQHCGSPVVFGVTIFLSESPPWREENAARTATTGTLPLLQSFPPCYRSPRRPTVVGYPPAIGPSRLRAALTSACWPSMLEINHTPVKSGLIGELCLLIPRRFRYWNPPL